MEGSKCYDWNVTRKVPAETPSGYRACLACGKPFPIDKRPGRTRQYCNATCRVNGRRDRLKDPEGWQRDTARLERRERARERRKAKEQAEWAEFERGVQRMGQLQDAEFDRMLREAQGYLDTANGRRQERHLDNPKIRALLVRALVSDSEHEATACLAAARRIQAKAVTNGP